MKSDILNRAYTSLQKWKEDMKDPSSEAYKEYLKQVEEQRKSLLKLEERVSELNSEVNSYTSFEDFMKNFQKEKDAFLDKAYDDGKYNVSYPKESVLFSLIKKIGSEMHPEVFAKLEDEFSSTAYYYKGYIFGVAHGQGSFLWNLKWDSNILGPEQMELF